MKPQKVVLYCGDRNWTDPGPIRRSFASEKPTLVIQGEARGADRMAREEAERREIEVLCYPANWKRYGRAAGPIRNAAMLRKLIEFQNAGATIKVVAFHRDLTKSKGTAHMVRLAETADVPVKVIK